VGSSAIDILVTLERENHLTKEGFIIV
jgi:hypothetical protein